MKQHLSFSFTAFIDALYGDLQGSNGAARLLLSHEDGTGISNSGSDAAPHLCHLVHVVVLSSDCAI